MQHATPDARFRDTRERILAAARSEVAEQGISGARINRIASKAGTSKERIYAYFRDKGALIEAVAQERMLSMESAIPFDASDLCSYVGALFDFYASSSDDVRILYWMNLQSADIPVAKNDPRLLSLERRVTLVRRAQRAGQIDPSWEPLTLLNLLVGIALAWKTAPRFVHGLEAASKTSDLLAKHRNAAVEAARRLLADGRRRDR